MKNLFSVVLLAMVLASFAGKSWAGCTASVAEVKPAQAVKAEAVAARDKGDYETAAVKFQEAATMHPMEAYKAAYLMNAVGCLLGDYTTRKGVLAYWWDAERGPKNAQAAFDLLKEVQDDLDKANADGCKYSSGVIASTQAWHDAQLKWLESQATPREGSLTSKPAEGLKDEKGGTVTAN